MAKIIFDPHHDGPALSGLDTFTGQPGASFSNMPESLVDGKTEEDAEKTEADAPPDASTSTGGEAVDEIAEALDESRQAEPAKPNLPPPGDLHSPAASGRTGYVEQINTDRNSAP